MKKGMVKGLGWLVVMAILVISLGCSFTVNLPETVEVGELQHESQTVELGEAKTARVKVDMGAGELTIRGGADSLMEADFTYNVADWRPQVEYTVVSDQGRLEVRQPDIRRINWGDEVRNEWDLRFNNTVPLEMAINLGAGESDLELGALNLTELDINGGAGDTRVDLSGNQSLTRMDFKMGVGATTFDLRGDWQQDLAVDIKGGVGQTTLRLPSEIGVRVEVTSGLGNVSAVGLHRDGNAYINDAYGKSDSTLTITIQAGVGEINLEVAGE